MKKRHEQKLVVLSIVFMIVINIPMVLMFNRTDAVFGIPIFYFSMFVIWMISIVMSFYILKRFYE